MKWLKTWWQRVRSWKGWRYVTAVRLVGAALGMVGVGIGVWAYLTMHGGAFDWKTLAEDYGANISTTLVGFTVAVLVIDVLNERRANADRKRAIIQQMGSPVNDAALEAVRLAKIEGWDKDGSLQKLPLFEANLRGANLVEANLRGAVLMWANLQGASMRGANLQGALLGEANLEKAHLSGANLKSVDLVGAHLQGAHLNGANLQNADLTLAILREFGQGNAQMNEDTILPDGNNWTLETDMARFTNPDHPNRWRSDNSDSPAYRGKKEED